MVTDDTSDELLAERACAGDQPALEELFVRHQAGLRAMVARSLADPEDVIDVVQDAFVDVIKGLHSYEPGRPFLPWMRVVTRNRLFRFLKDRRRRAAVAVAEALEPADAGDEPDWTEDEIGLLRECVGALGDAARRLVGWRYRDGLPVADLKECLKRKGVTA
jgi:RNA polymerase sigma-70 factor (ECF subfamily)